MSFLVWKKSYRTPRINSGYSLVSYVCIGNLFLCVSWNLELAMNTVRIKGLILFMQDDDGYDAEFERSPSLTGQYTQYREELLED